jgi:hypothetical protein
MLISTVDYIFLKYKDVYTLKNIGSISINYSISRVVNSVPSVITSGVILPSATSTLSLGNFDGTYQLDITAVNNTAEPIKIKYFPTLLQTIISKIKEITCKECGSCDKCEDPKLQLSLLIAVLNYAYLQSPIYNEYFESLNLNLNDVIINKTTKYLSENLVYGQGNVSPLVIQTVGAHYLSFYYTDLVAAKDPEEVSYVKAKYNAADVITCLNSIGIIVPNTETVTTTGIDIYYWQLLTSTETINNVLAPLTDIYLASKDKDTLKNFSIGKTINYSNIAKAAFVIKGALSDSFALYDSLNNNVTAQFDKIYNPTTKTILFVSKANYSFSNIFFKIKNLNI